MPQCGSQCFLCDLPIRFDTYKGCSHGCKYCFANKFYDIRKIKKDEGVIALKRFTEGIRGYETNWCDWNIPIHWGGLSDPFQPCEKARRISFECLKVFAETQYPYIVSTKGKLIIDPEYINLIGESNAVVQISVADASYDVLEPNAPTFNERLNMIEKLAPKAKRVIVRIQPYFIEKKYNILKNLSRFKDNGAYGVIVEGIKSDKKKSGWVKIGGDFVYPYDIILRDFLELKEEAHAKGLRIFAGENRIRKYGDSLTCCGIEGLDGFVPNTYNLNHILNGEKVKPTEGMKQKGTAFCFRALEQKTANEHKMKEQSFEYSMIECYKKRKGSMDKIFGLVH